MRISWKDASRRDSVLKSKSGFQVVAEFLEDGYADKPLYAFIYYSSSTSYEHLKVNEKVGPYLRQYACVEIPVRSFADTIQESLLVDLQSDTLLTVDYKRSPDFSSSCPVDHLPLRDLESRQHVMKVTVTMTEGIGSDVKMMFRFVNRDITSE